MIYLLLSLILFSIGCLKSPTAPNCVTLKREEIRQTITSNGRLIFITVIAPETTKCDGN